MAFKIPPPVAINLTMRYKKCADRSQGSTWVYVLLKHRTKVIKRKFISPH